MFLRHDRLTPIAVLSIATLFVNLEARGHGVIIGQDGAGQLHVHVASPQPLALPLSIFPNVSGWAAVEPGITAAEIDEPDVGIFMLAPNCDIQFELISFEAGVQIVTSHVWVPGETYPFGPPAFDYHLLFNIPAGDAGEVYELQFKVRDLNGVYADSPNLLLLFSAGGACHCRGDFDHDHSRDGREIQSFVNCMVAAEPGHPIEDGCGCADLNSDGALTGADIQVLVTDLLVSEPCD